MRPRPAIAPRSRPPAVLTPHPSRSCPGQDSRPRPQHEHGYALVAYVLNASRPDLPGLRCLVAHRPVAGVIATACMTSEQDHVVRTLVAEQDLPTVYIAQGTATPIGEALRLDVGKALKSALDTRDLQVHSARLEETVARRTRELQEEVRIRRSAEQRLQAANAELYRLAMQDGLSGIANRSA